MNYKNADSKLSWTLLLFVFLHVNFVTIIKSQDNKENLNLTTDQWRQDLKYFADNLPKKHKNAFHFTSRERFEKSVAKLNLEIPNLKSYEIVVGFQKLAAMIGDGHTFLAAENLQRFYPIDFYWFGNELRVVRADRKYKRALGAKLISINGLNLAEINERLKSVIPQCENAWYVLSQSSDKIIRADLLAALKITPTPETAEMTFAGDNNESFTLSLKSVAPNAAPNWADVVENKPLYLQRPDESFWFTYLPEKKTIYVCFRNYNNLPENAKKLLAFIDEKKAENLIIDLRQNSGGNYNLVRQHLIYQLATNRLINQKNHFFVITGRKTFSAAMTNSIDFRRETDALLVGEPPGARPLGYQENSWIKLPNSRLRISASMLYYKFMDTDTPTVEPDRLIETAWKDYANGRDSVLEAILSGI